MDKLSGLNVSGDVFRERFESVAPRVLPPPRIAPTRATLYLALLSIDSYNRGYDFNLADGLNADPNNQQDPDSLGGRGVADRG